MKLDKNSFVSYDSGRKQQLHFIRKRRFFMKMMKAFCINVRKFPLATIFGASVFLVLQISGIFIPKNFRNKQPVN